MLWKSLGSGAQFSIWSRSSLVIQTTTLFSRLGTDVHISGDETGLQWEDYLFEMQNAVEWRMVMSRGQDERTQMHAMSLLLSTCEVMTNRALIDDGEHENRTAGVKALNSMLASTTSGRAKELVKQGLSDRNGMIALADWKSLGEPLLKPAQVRLRSATGDDMGVSGSFVVRGWCGGYSIEMRPTQSVLRRSGGGRILFTVAVSVISWQFE